MTLEQIANWNSYQNPLEKVYGRESIAPTITTRVAESIGGGINASTILACEDFNDTRNLRHLYRTRKEEKDIEEMKVWDGYNQQARADSSVVGALTRNCGADLKRKGQGTIEGKYRIRKLTPRECWRLMGVKDEDFDKVKENQSNSSLYHLAGDSIVVDVLMAIFKQML